MEHRWSHRVAWVLFETFENKIDIEGMTSPTLSHWLTLGGTHCTLMFLESCSEWRTALLLLLMRFDLKQI